MAQWCFVVIILFFLFLITKRARRIKKNIALGRDFEVKATRSVRIKNMLLIAFGQKKMFKRFVPAILHLMVYVGFLLINIEVLEIIIDGIFGTHRVFAIFLGNFYNILINFFEFLCVLVMLSCVFFLIRRNVLKLDRFYKEEMKGWPSLDANLILIIEILLMSSILWMNALDQVLQMKHVAGYINTGIIYFSSLLMPSIEDFEVLTLVFLERFAWWFHIVGIFAFALYVTYSKHLHLFLSFPNTYFSNFEPVGKMKNMNEVTREVKLMLGMETTAVENLMSSENLRFGAKDVNDLTWKNLMGAYSCTECGRCTSVCPANITGKRLSPRNIMMKTRDRLEEVGNGGLEDKKSLLHDYISLEEINACTTCNACLEACPIQINPLDIILQLRRYAVMEESKASSAWNSMFQNIETNFAPWKLGVQDRFKWSEELTKSKVKKG